MATANAYDWDVDAALAATAATGSLYAMVRQVEPANAKKKRRSAKREMEETARFYASQDNKGQAMHALYSYKPPLQPAVTDSTNKSRKSESDSDSDNSELLFDSDVESDSSVLAVDDGSGRLSPGSYLYFQPSSSTGQLHRSSDDDSSDEEEEEEENSQSSDDWDETGSDSEQERRRLQVRGSKLLAALHQIRAMDESSISELCSRLQAQRGSGMRQALRLLVSASRYQWKQQQYRTKNTSGAQATKQRDDDDDDDDEKDETTKQHDSAAEESTQWNTRFQAALLELRQSGGNPDRKIATYQVLSRLAQDFVQAAKTYGQIIISEVYTDPAHKTIKPIALGGFAGGEKYIVNGILFKFAVDSVGIYGSDEIAMKAAGHELKGLMAYFNLDLPDLHFPLMALVDFLGFRVIAMSILPIGKSTIVYGTADAGRSLYTDDAQMNDTLKHAAERLGLKPHWAGRPPCEKLVWSAADVEGHLGLDGKRYLLDFARTFPPRQRDESARNSHLHQLFRAEFLLAYTKPLCSDAYSGFVPPYDAAEHIIEIEEATRFLTKRLIPKLASWLDDCANKARSVQRTTTSSQTASALPQQQAKLIVESSSSSSSSSAGRSRPLLNVRSWRKGREERGDRLRDVLARKIKRRGHDTTATTTATAATTSTSGSLPAVGDSGVASSESSGLDVDGVEFDGQQQSIDGWLDVKRSLHEMGVNLRYLGLVRRHCWDEYVRSALMIEMLARTIKHILRKKIRSLMRQLKAPVSSPFLAVIVHTLNLVFGTSEQSTHFWNTKLKRQLVAYFPYSLLREQRADDYNLKTVLSEPADRSRLCVAVVRCAELRLRTKCLRELLADPHVFAYAQPFDETDLEEMAASVRHMNIVELAQGYVLKHKGRLSLVDSTRTRLFKMALDKFESALARNATDSKSLREMADTAYLLKNEALADHYYNKLIERDPNDPVTLFKYASFLEATKQDALAEEVYLQALEADPTSDHCMQSYGSFLDAHAENELAERFFFTASHMRSLKRELDQLPQSK